MSDINDSRPLYEIRRARLGTILAPLVDIREYGKRVSDAYRVLFPISEVNGCEGCCELKYDGFGHMLERETEKYEVLGVGMVNLCKECGEVRVHDIEEREQARS